MAALPKEPSGVVVHKGSVFVVGNESDGQYFRFDAANLPSHCGITKLSDLGPSEAVEVAHRRAKDLESIGVLEDEIVVLSEESRRIIFQDRTVVGYNKLSAFDDSGGRGLEGMSIRLIHEQASEIAVLWEGGIHKKDRTRWDLPRLLVHEIAHSEFGMNMVLHKQVWEDRIVHLKLGSGLPDQKFRCPDLTWCWSTEAKEWAVLALLSHRAKDSEKYLQVYSTSGEPLGQAEHLEQLGMPSDEGYVLENWEGLCWHTDGQGEDHLLLVNDTSKESKQYVCRLTPPADCRRQAPS